jgi:predicted Zn-dependent protease
MHHQLKRRCAKLAVTGCGCLLLLGLVVGIIVLAGTSGVKGKIYGFCKNLWTVIPKQVQLPQEVNLPAELGLPESIRLPRLPNLFTISAQEQILLGREVAQKEGFDSEAFIDTRVESVGMRLVHALPIEYRGPAESGGWAWRFRGLRTKNGSVNAVALPGGKIFLYDGLITLIEGDPNQLAAIIGHEMGHVVEEHAAKQLRTEGLLQKASQLVLENAGGEAESPQSQVIKTIAARMGKRIAQMQLSQAAEFKADSLGIRFMKAANYDGAAFITVLSKLDQISVQRKGILSGVFSTHPPTDRRTQEIQEMLNSPVEKAY